MSNLRRFAVDPSAEARRPSEIEAGVEEELLEQLNDAENPGEEGLSTSCRTRDRNYSIRMQIWNALAQFLLTCTRKQRSLLFRLPLGWSTSECSSFRTTTGPCDIWWPRLPSPSWMKLIQKIWRKTTNRAVIQFISFNGSNEKDILWTLRPRAYHRNSSSSRRYPRAKRKILVYQVLKGESTAPESTGPEPVLGCRDLSKPHSRRPSPAILKDTTHCFSSNGVCWCIFPLPNKIQNRATHRSPSQVPRSYESP